MKRVLVLLVVLVLAAGAAIAFLYTRLQSPYRGYQASEQYVEIPQGTGTRAIGERLVAAGVVRDELTYRVALWLTGDARRLQAGEYRFDRPMTAGEVLDKIARGEIDAVPVTFPEGLTLDDTARTLEAHGVASAAAFEAAARDPSLVRSFDPAAKDLEGYLFPDTYLVTHLNAVERLVHLMVERFEKIATPELRAAVAAKGLTIRKWVTLASIVEKETGQKDERPMVAAVYENRLRIGMALQCDPTVIYALSRAGKYSGSLHHDDLAFDSPYNTYRYPGLPPGPIASPGKQSLEAVLNPADVKYLYFVSRNDGTHVFANSLEEHNRNVSKFQRSGRPGD
jgi:UPF0755 protein